MAAVATRPRGAPPDGPGFRVFHGGRRIAGSDGGCVADADAVGVWRLAAAHPMGAAAGTLRHGTTTVGVRRASGTVRGAKTRAAALTMGTVADACVGMREGLAHADWCGWLPPSQ